MCSIHVQKIKQTFGEIACLAIKGDAQMKLSLPIHIFSLVALSIPYTFNIKLSHCADTSV